MTDDEVPECGHRWTEQMLDADEYEHHCGLAPGHAPLGHVCACGAEDPPR